MAGNLGDVGRAYWGLLEDDLLPSEGISTVLL